MRVELQSHHDAESFAEKLQAEGRTVTRRWKYLLVSANDEDDAEAFAKQIESEAPAGATVHVEPGSGLAWEFTPTNWFAVFGGGLGGLAQTVRARARSSAARARASRAATVRCPSVSRGSSTRNPGPSVAISISIPSGMRK